MDEHYFARSITIEIILPFIKKVVIPVNMLFNAGILQF